MTQAVHPLAGHREAMVAHFLWLHELEQRFPSNAGYARHAVQHYRNSPGCPCPDIAETLTQALAAQKGTT